MLNNYDVFEDKENNVFQIRTKEDVFLVRFDGEVNRGIFLDIIDITQEKNILYKDLLTKLKEKHKESQILPVINELKESGVFNKNYIYRENDINNSLSNLLNQQDEFSHLKTNKSLEIIGSGELFESFKKVVNKNDYSALYLTEVTEKNYDSLIRKAFKRADFVIIENNRWGPNFLEKVNRISLTENRPWLLVRGMWRGYGSIGPLFYGKETGCYECLSARIKSNIEHLKYFLSYEKHLKDNDKFSKPDSSPAGFHEIISSIAIFDVLKYLGEKDIPETYGNIINILPSLTTEKHKLLKNPLCDICKPTLEYNISPWLSNISLKS